MIMTYGNAIYQALHDEMENDLSVVLFGEDLQHNLYGYTGGLVQKFGEDRVIDIPLSENSVVGAACGAAMCGLKTIVDLTVPNFMYVAMDQIASIAAKTKHMYNGQYDVPLTILCSSMQGNGNAAQHSDRLHSLFANIPGLIILCPATPQDMYSLLREGIQSNSPVLCFADRSLFWQKDDVDTNITNLIGKAHIVREGDNLTIVTISGCLTMIEEILPELAERGIQPDIIDIRTVNPLDYETIKKSVEKTGKVVICDTANRKGSTANDIASYLSENAFFYLKDAIQIVAGENVPVPFEKGLEQKVLVSKDKIYNTIIKMFKQK